MRVLVTGAASGFGAALADIYARRGDHVMVSDLHEQPPVGLQGPTAGGEVVYRRLDVRNAEDWSHARAWVVDHWGGLDLLINNAGVAAGGRVDVLPIDDWEWILATNLLGTVRGCREFVPVFTAQRSGRIANVASMAGLVHPPGMSSYNAAKSGVVALSETLLHELAPYGVGVSVICPTFFRSNLDRSLRGSDPPMEEAARRLITEARTDAATTAARTVKALDRGRYLVLPHKLGWLAYGGKRVMTPLYHRAMKQVGVRVAAAGRNGPDGPRPRTQRGEPRSTSR